MAGDELLGAHRLHVLQVHPAAVAQHPNERVHLGATQAVLAPVHLRLLPGCGLEPNHRLERSHTMQLRDEPAHRALGPVVAHRRNLAVQHRRRKPHRSRAPHPTSQPILVRRELARTTRAAPTGLHNRLTAQLPAHRVARYPQLPRDRANAHPSSCQNPDLHHCLLRQHRASPSTARPHRQQRWVSFFVRTGSASYVRRHDGARSGPDGSNAA